LNLSAIKSYRVANYLLTNQDSSQIDISQKTGVSIGYVNEVVHELANLNVVNIKYGKCILENPVKLLEKISFDRPFRKLCYLQLRLPTLSIKETENTLIHFCRLSKIKYAFSVFSALKNYYEYHISYPSVHIYLNNPQKIHEIEKGEGIIPVFILKPDRPDIIKNSLIRNNQNVCDKTQVIIDLYSSGIGRDAAIKYYRDTVWKKEIF